MYARLFPSFALTLAILWRVIYAYWTPVIDRFLVPPGDDPAFHLARIEEIISGTYQLFFQGYPLGFHYLVASIASVFHLPALSAVIWITPLLLILPIPIIYRLGTTLFEDKNAGAWTAFLWSVFALAPVRSYGDGIYPNMFAASVLLPLLILLLYQLTYKKQPKRLSILLLLLLAIILPFTHHLTVIYTLVSLAPWLIWILARKMQSPDTQVRTRWLVGTGVVGLLLLGTLLVQTYLPLIEPFLQALQGQKNYQAIVGIGNPALTVASFVETHGIVFSVLAIFGLCCLLSAKKVAVSTRVLLIGWLLGLSLVGIYFSFGLPFRFIRELALPMALLAGYGMARLSQSITKLPRAFVLPAKLSITIAMILCWHALLFTPFGLPGPYIPRIRVQHDEELGLALLNDLGHQGGTILANNSNPYLPYLIESSSVLIVTDPASITPALLIEQDVRIVYIGARPPLTPAESYPFFRSFDEIRYQLEQLPNLTPIKTYPSGTTIYQVNETP